jgi:hypothetical protein
VAGSRVRDCVNAAVDALKADSALIALLGSAKVNTHVPQGTDPPYVQVLGGDEIPWVATLACSSFTSPAESDGGDSGGRQVDVLVQCVSTYRGTVQVDGIASRVLEVLTDVDTWPAVTGWQLTEFVRNGFQPPVDLNADGVLWFVRIVTVRVSLT